MSHPNLHAQRRAARLNIGIDVLWIGGTWASILYS